MSHLTNSRMITLMTPPRNGYDLMHAMQDTMDEKQLMLVLTLLSKNPDDEVIQLIKAKTCSTFYQWMLAVVVLNISKESIKLYLREV